MADEWKFPETSEGRIDWLLMEEMERRGVLPDVGKGALYEAQNRGLVGPTKGSLRAQGGDLPFGERFQRGVADIGEGAVQLINKVTGGGLERNFGETLDQQI